MTLSLLIEQLINGLVTGSMYALMGAGVTLVYGTMRVMNFAHGEFFMIGGYALFMALIWAELPLPIAAALAVLAVAISAIVLQRLLIQPLLKSHSWELDAIVTTLGLSFILQNGALRTIGEEYYSLPYFIEGSQRLGPVTLSNQRLLILGVAILTLSAMALFLRGSRAGQALRAVSQDPEAAAILGISTRRIYALAFGLSGLLAGTAAVMLAPIQSVNPWMGAPMLLKGFVVVILGGMGSFGGTILAAFAIGMIEALGTTLTSTEWREIFSFAALILILWFKPEGLFGRMERKA